MKTEHTKFFKVALQQAEKALKADEVPIGAVLVRGGRLIAKAHNLTEKRQSFLAHAEMLCLLQASRKLKSKFIDDAKLYVTVEPCMMCRFAARLCRINSVYYLAPSEKFGRNTKRYFHTQVRRLSFSTQRDNAILYLKNFFQSKRSSKIE